MPLAVVRHTLSELPLKVTLSDAQAMIDTMKISAYKELVIGARISLSGNPVAQAGDLYQELSGVDATNIQSPENLRLRFAPCHKATNPVHDLDALAAHFSTTPLAHLPDCPVATKQLHRPVVYVRQCRCHQ